MPRRPNPGRRFGLFWRVFGLNAALLTLAVVLLAVTPATISDPITADQLALLVASAAVALLANALLIRMSLRPLRRLAGLMENVDVLRPGERLEADGAKELATLANAFNAMLDRIERERRTSTSRAIGGQEVERRQLATDLHDQIGQSLTALLLLLQPVVEDGPPDLAESMREAREIVHDALDEVRRITRQLRPSVLDDLGLSAGLRSLCAGVERASGVRIDQRYPDRLPELPDEIELALYRVAQEALTNVTRHAEASFVSLSLACEDGRMELTVSDDGRGMVHTPELEQGGIRGMRERVLAVGGDVRIAAAPAAGTTVKVSLPVGGIV